MARFNLLSLIGVVIAVPLALAGIPIPGEHFYTPNANEADNAATHLGYAYEGISGYIFPASKPGLEPLYRVYNPRLSRHFYTANMHERDQILQGGGWSNEGICGYVYASPTPGSVPFYRLYNGPVFDHLYTSSAAEVNSAEKAGYILEGIQCYLPIDANYGAVALYRLFRKCKEGQNPKSMLVSKSLSHIC